MDDTVTIGKNVVIKEGVELHYVVIGDGVKIGKNTTIFGSKDNYAHIGKNTYISPNCYCNGAFGLEIGEEVTISAGVMIFTDSGPNRGPLTKIYPTKEAKISIGDGSWIGAGSILLPGANLGKNAVLAANSTLNTVIKKNEVFGGNLAKLLKKNDV